MRYECTLPKALSKWLSCASSADIRSTCNAGCHPLDPLSPEEIKTTAGIIKAKAAELSLPNLRFNVITLAVSPQPPAPQPAAPAILCSVLTAHDLNVLSGLPSMAAGCFFICPCNFYILVQCRVPDAHVLQKIARPEGPRLLRGPLLLLQEPAKAELIAFDRNPDEVPPRAANVILQAFPVAPLIEATVLLAASKPSITSWVEVRLLKPPACLCTDRSPAFASNS